MQDQATNPTSPTASHTDAALGWFQEMLQAEVVKGVTVQGLVLMLLAVLGAFVVSRIVQGALNRAFQRRKVHDQGAEAVIKRLTHYVVMVAGVFLALNLAGFSLTSLFAAGAVFAVVIGFALQNLSENFVSGVILMVERSITPGDVLEVEGRVVRVIRMGIRATVARTRDDEDLIIPNSMLVTTTVKNYTLRDSLYRLRTVVGVVYSSDMALVRNVLTKTAENFPGRHEAKQPRILLTEFGSSSVNFEVSVWIEDPWHAQMMRSGLNGEIWDALKAAGITIAFPQLDLHLDGDVVRALKARAGADGDG